MLYVFGGVFNVSPIQFQDTLCADTAQCPGGWTTASLRFGIPSYPSTRPPQLKEMRLAAWTVSFSLIRARTQWTHACMHTKLQRNVRLRAAAGLQRGRRVEDDRRAENLKAEQSFPHRDGRVCPFRRDFIRSHLRLTWKECKMMFLHLTKFLSLFLLLSLSALCIFYLLRWSWHKV